MFSNNKKEALQAIEISNSSNIIGKGTSLEGNLNTAGNLRVEGKIIGEITSKAKVVLSNTSWVQGSIVAQNAEVGGEVQGTLEILELLTLKPTAVIQGDIITNKLVFEEGAKFNGKCKMGTQAKQAALASPDTLQKSNGSFFRKKNQPESPVPKEQQAP